MSAGRAPSLRPSRFRPSALWRRCSTTLPAVTWVAAIVAAVCLYRRSTAVESVTGYAQDATVTVTHYEPCLVQQVHTRLFEQVSHGQVLLSLDDRQEQIELATIQVDVERLRAAVLAERERISADNARAATDSEDLARQFATGREDARVAYLSECVSGAQQQALLRGRRIDYEILRQLADSGNASPREVNEIRTEVEALEAALAARAEVLTRAREAAEEAERRWQTFAERPDVAVSGEPVLTPLWLAIDVKTRELEDVVRRIKTHVVRAPIDGQIAALGVRAGDQVPAGVLLLSIAPSSTNEVIAYLPERMALSVSAGDRVEMSCLAPTGKSLRGYKGQVTRVAPGVTEVPLRYRPLPTFPVWGRGIVIALSQDVRLIPGEAVRISFGD